MQFWHDAIGAECATNGTGDVIHAHGLHFRLCPDGKHHALWDVFQHGKSHGGRGYGGGHGGFDAHALYPGDCRYLGAGFPDGACGRKTGFESRL